MPRHADVPVGRTPVELTGSDAGSITIQNKGNLTVRVLPSATDAAPSASDPCIELAPGMVILDNELSALFGGFAGALRVFGVCPNGEAVVYVSHA